jgi:hypothetical protein
MTGTASILIYGLFSCRPDNKKRGIPMGASNFPNMNKLFQDAASGSGVGVGVGVRVGATVGAGVGVGGT